MLLQQGWTLCYEEQFYAVCGVLLFLRREWFNRSLVVVTAAVALLVAINGVRPLPIDGFFWDGRWLMFAAGILVFRVAQFGFNRRLAFALLVFCFVLAAMWFVTMRDNMAQEMMFSFGFAALLMLLFRYDLMLSDMPALAPLKLCGTMCYSLYLIHWPTSKLISKALYTSGLQGPWQTLLITIPACVAASLALAWVFHRAVEQRFMPKVHRKLSPTLVESRKLSITMS